MKKLLTLITLSLVAGTIFLTKPSLAVEPQPENNNASFQCTVLLSTTPIYSNTKFNVTVTGSSANKTYRASLRDRNRSISDNYTREQQSGVALTRLTFGPFNSGGYLDPNLSPYEIVVDDITNSNNPKICGTTGPFTVKEAPGSCTVGFDKSGGFFNPSTKVVVTSDSCGQGYTATPVDKNSGQPPPQPSAVADCKCLTVAQGGGTPSGSSGSIKIGKPAPCVQTDLGCIPTDPGKLASAIFSIILGLAGGLAVIMIIVGGFKVATSQGNVDALQDGRDTITKAITGLAFILLATTILGIIGIDILGIPFFRRDGTGIIFNQK